LTQLQALEEQDLAEQMVADALAAFADGLVMTEKMLATLVAAYAALGGAREHTHLADQMATIFLGAPFAAAFVQEMTEKKRDALAAAVFALGGAQEVESFVAVYATLVRKDMRVGREKMRAALAAKDAPATLSVTTCPAEVVALLSEVEDDPWASLAVPFAQGVMVDDWAAEVPDLREQLEEAKEAQHVASDEVATLKEQVVAMAVEIEQLRALSVAAEGNEELKAKLEKYMAGFTKAKELCTTLKDKCRDLTAGNAELKDKAALLEWTRRLGGEDAPSTLAVTGCPAEVEVPPSEVEDDPWASRAVGFDQGVGVDAFLSSASDDYGVRSISSDSYGGEDSLEGLTEYAQ
jgi:hypothetical protein